MSFYVQSPNEDLLYQFAWSNTIPANTAIVTSTWSVSPTGPTLSGAGVVSFTTYVNVSGLTLGQRYRLINTIELDNGETYEASSYIYAENK